MRPYLTIIKDSFREAMVSRVLWVLLALITFFLLLLAPIGIEESAATRFQGSDFVAPQVLLVRIAGEKEEENPTISKHVFGLWRRDMQDAVVQLSKQTEQRAPAFIYARFMGDAFNELLDDRDLYKPALWEKAALGDEARSLIAKGVDKLDDKQLARLNRLLLDAAYPLEIRPTRGVEVTFFYLHWRIFGPAAGSRDALLKTALTQFADRILGVIGVFVAILVTATMIPRTFEGGSVDLLLSKPVSRSGVFLAKFAGGCAFVTLLAAYFLGGLWLVVGVRHGLWHGSLWLCVPLMLFLFSIYYAVSALSGLVFKNGIIAVVITIVFWGLCFGVWLAKATLETFLPVTEIAAVLPVDDGVLVVTPASLMAGHVFEEWDQKKREWSPTKRNEVQVNLPAGLRVPVPGGTMAVFDGGGNKTILVTPQDILLYDPKEPPGPNQPIDFTAVSSVGPGIRLKTPFAAAMNAKGDLALYDSEELRTLSMAEGKYKVVAERPLEGRGRYIMAYGGQRILLAGADGAVRIVKAGDLSIVEELPADDDRAPRAAFASSDGRYFAVVTPEKHLWLYDAERKKDVSGAITGQGYIASLTFSEKTLLVANSYTRVTEYDLSDMKVARRFEPSLSAVEWAYWYPIRGIYTVFPKPGELGNMVQYLITERKASSSESDDPEDQGSQLNLWQPVWSNLIFVAVLLAIGCLYVSRKDF